MSPPCVVPNGGNTSDGLTHTSVGSRASALGPAHKYTHASTQVQDHSCGLVAVERKGTCLDLPKLNCCSVTLDNLPSESQCILISLKTAKTVSWNEWRVKVR